MSKKIVIELTKEQRDYLVSAMTCGAVVFNVKEAAELLTEVNAASALDRSVIKWHKYPEEVPNAYGYYLIKEESGNVALEHFGAYGFEDPIGIKRWADPNKDVGGVNEGEGDAK